MKTLKIVIVTGTPKHDGLACECAQRAKEGVELAGAEAEIVRLSDYNLHRCAVCGEGWGTCREEHVCSFGKDGFEEISQKLAEADAVVLATPVYWGEMTETMKAFFDRYRRCEAMRGKKGGVGGKQVLLVASPGGSGNGMVSCFEQMERLSKHLHMEIFDFVGVNRLNHEYKLDTIRAAAAGLVMNSHKNIND